ncbi:LysM peptidoglycan-binding domain-containing protein [uncultured Cellulomonas sp.]|uniref:LysM peptidoglycan-binding domain-containing protein n=1 Tax=uncultured Cellulomonas sp. TaxID=189682 RepID=UPI00261E9FE1|nr:LysM peptidoglycan-binding domain-containing protein [uncultured Cellulomonas sp.]
MSAATWAPAPSSRGELRLTPRGRRVVWTAAVLLAGGALLTGGRAVAEAPAPAVPVDTYTVGSGESLWSIAAGFTDPGEDVRVTVDDLADLNNMASSELVAGQQILVPTAD